MRLPAPTNLTTWGFAVALAVLAGIFWFALRNTARLTEAGAWRAHTEEAIAEIRGLYARVVDAQAGFRGYVMTGDELFLEPYAAALPLVPRELDALRRLTSDNPSQQQRLDSIEPVVRAQLADIAERIVLRRERGFEVAAARSRVLESKRRMDLIRAGLGDMESEERRLLVERERQMRTATTSSEVTLLAGAIVGVSLLVGVFLGLNREVRQRRAAEVDLRASQQELQTFFDMSQDLVAIAGLSDGFFKRVNPSWERALGHTADDMTRVPFVEFIHPDDVAPTQSLYREQLERGTVVMSFENRYRCKDGSYRWLQWSSKPDEKTGLIYALARDVTVQRDAREELRRAKERAEAANAELEAFSYSVSHDLRSPLRAIDGFSQVLLEDHGDKLDLHGKDCLQRVRAAAQHMAQLIDDMLKLSRISRAELNSEPIDLSGLARDVAAEVRLRNPERSTAIEVQAGLAAAGDPQLLRVALENLISNAWKFTRKQPEARIEIGAQPANGRAVYYVKDNGAGFDMQYADKLFGAFQRLHPTQEFEGTGIGLATVARVIARHGGRIWAQALPGEGATFYFTLSEPERSRSGERQV